MASNKNQHFVPKCYLRSFSSDPDSASIHLFNIERCRSIRGASIKGQCSSNYFYGDSPSLENALQTMEREYGRFLQCLARPDYRLTADHSTILRLFCLLQYCRTEALVRRQIDFMRGMTDAAFDGATPPEYQATAKETVQISLRTFADTMSIVDDLKVKLLCNRTSLDFIASDNPSIHTNRWHLQNPRARGKSPGIASAGVLLFLPLTPRIFCVVYDGDVYSIDHENNWVDLKHRDDVECLNEHQFLNCQHNVYFSNWDSMAIVKESYEKIAEQRPIKRHEVVTAVLDKEDGWGKRYKVVPLDQMKGEEGLVHVKELLPRPTRWPRFLRMRSDAKIYSNNSGAGFVRKWSLDQGIYSGVGYKKI